MGASDKDTPRVCGTCDHYLSNRNAQRWGRCELVDKKRNPHQVACEFFMERESWPIPRKQRRIEWTETALQRMG
jgi:hypothetical protein